ncbi:putative WD40-repeat-containing domain protein [Seiridium cardinale]
MEDSRERSNTLSTSTSNTSASHQDPRPETSIRKNRPQLRLETPIKAHPANPDNAPSRLYAGPVRCISFHQRGGLENSRLVPADVYLDGAWSTSSTSNDEEPQSTANPRQRATARQPIPRTPATDPRVKSLRPDTLTSFWSDSEVHRRRQRPLPIDGTPSSRGRSPRPSDRFIPSRETSGPLHNRFRTAKDPHRLSTSERILRHGDATPDPFCFRPPRSAPDKTSHQESRSDGSGRRAGTTVGIIPRNAMTLSSTERQVSIGAVWSVGGIAPGSLAVDDGRGQYMGSGTNAPLYTMPFTITRPKSEEHQEKHEGRLAQALDIDRVQRVLDYDGYSTFPRCSGKPRSRPTLHTAKTTWTGTEWSNDKHRPVERRKSERILPSAPFKILDAPGIRDDFYCSIMAYSSTCNVLAIGLGSLLYGWSESTGVSLLNTGAKDRSWLTSVAFSSDDGGKSVLAFGRSSGYLGLLSLFDSLLPRFEAHHPHPIACLKWRPVTTTRPSLNPYNPGVPVETEDLLVGEEGGDVYYYSVEWPGGWEVARDTWPGALTLLARITVHTQQICGLAWSHDGELFATGGNDNKCCLFAVGKILGTEAAAEDVKVESSVMSESQASTSSSAEQHLPTILQRVMHNDCKTPLDPSAAVFVPSHSGSGSAVSWADWLPDYTIFPEHFGPTGVPTLSADDQNVVNPEVPQTPPAPSVKIWSASDALQTWYHLAAVKAIAFCPWRPHLLATGGGSNDRMIHFFHTTSGAALATISVSAQVTSLVWSTTRREIAATFGYAQPDHNIRIAVFSWPECQMVGSVKWDGNHRALFAIPYPGGPNEPSVPTESDVQDFSETSPDGASSRISPEGNIIGRTNRSRRRRKVNGEGCLIVAASDNTIKFHEIWGIGRGKSAAATEPGVLGGSDIIEMAEGIDKEGDIIR